MGRSFIIDLLLHLVDNSGKGGDFMRESIITLKEWIDGTNNIVFFGGAGVSTESGLPDFRSQGGIYDQQKVRTNGGVSTEIGELVHHLKEIRAVTRGI